MRILTVQNLYPPHAFGGYEDLCAGAVRQWRDAGHEVVVLASDWRRPDVGADAPDGPERVERVLPFYWDDHRILRPSARESLRRDRTSRRLTGALLDELAPDVVSVWNAAGLSFGIFDELVRRSLPTVLVVLDRWLAFGLAMDGWGGRFRDGVGGAMAPLVAAVTGTPTRVPTLGTPVVGCFASRHLQDHAHQTSPWALDAEAVVPHGLDASRYAPPDPGQPVPAWRGRLLYVGRVAPTKGVETVVRAVARLPATQLDVVGPADADTSARVAALVDELDVADRVHLRGEAAPEQLSRAYGEADALVFPSEWQEPFGIVPLEAMARGLPVIGTGTGGSGEFLVDGVTSVRFRPGDVDDLVDAVRRLAGDQALRARLRTAGLEVAAWRDRARANEELLAWHAWAADRCRGPRPADRPVLPEHLRTTASGRAVS